MEATKIEKGRQPYGKPSKDDPYAWATAALIQVNPSWKGDRHKKMRNGFLEVRVRLLRGLKVYFHQEIWEVNYEID